MLLPRKIRGAKKMFLMSVMVILVILIGYLLYDNFLSNYLKPGDSVEVNVKPLVVPAINTEFETDFLSKEPYINLKENGDLPVKPGRLGRPNPFLSIPFSILD